MRSFIATFRLRSVLSMALLAAGSASLSGCKLLDNLHSGMETTNTTKAAGSGDASTVGGGFNKAPAGTNVGPAGIGTDPMGAPRY